MQIVCVAGVNDGHVAASESVLMDVLLMLGAYTHRDPPRCEGIEFETSPARSPPCSVDDNRHLSQQPAQRIMNTLCSLNESWVVRLIGDYIDTGEDRAQVAL
jgi:hypothetical protein